MIAKPWESGRLGWLQGQAGRAYAALAPRACSIILGGALLYNLAAKLFHAERYGLLREYPSWILTDIAVLAWLDGVLLLVCWRWPRRGVIRGALVLAAAVCTWSVMNAGWLIRTGTQILPMEIAPLVRDPLNTSWIVLVNLARMPAPAAILLVPSAMALVFFFSVLGRAAAPPYDRRHLRLRVVASLLVGIAALAGDAAFSGLGSTPPAAAGLRFNCQLRAVLAFVLPEYRHVARSDFKHATRKLPRCDEVAVRATPCQVPRNIVIVILEGVQYDATSLALEQGGIAPQTGGRLGGLTPYLATLASEGVVFPNTRAVVTHTTKAIFALLTGRAPAAAQDIAETVPVDRPYAGLATILRNSLGMRSAFFQSAKGTFESRPGLVHNLGFDRFWSREDLNDPNDFVGYLGCDEFALLDPIADWIRSEDRPFLLVALCSVTHDPYEVPAWFGPHSKDPVERYLQAVSYTDRFLAALDTQLEDLHRAEDTIFCVVGDHGEGFGEHRILGHERLGFDEVLRVALCLRAPGLIAPGTRVTAPVSSMDLTPTLLGLVGFDTAALHLDGLNALQPLPADRRLYFSGWMQQGPAGFVHGDRKFVYSPDRDAVIQYDLQADPLELAGAELPEAEARRISEEIGAWRKSTIFRPEPSSEGNVELFGAWLWKSNGRVSRLKDVEAEWPHGRPCGSDALRCQAAPPRSR